MHLHDHECGLGRSGPRRRGATGIGKSDAVWDSYLNAYKVVDDDTAGFWGTKNLGRFVNDQTPGNLDPDYKAKIEELRADLRAHLDKKFGLK